MKPTAGVLFSLVVIAANSGYVMIFDAASAPADGAVTPTWVYPLTWTGMMDRNWTQPLAFANGIVVVFSSTGPFTKTASATAFICGQAQ